jgi:hypothetical protein
MRTIYIDSDNKCHIADDGTMKAVETDFFDGMCNAFVEGYCYEVKETGFAIYPWQPLSELDAAQREYERQLLAEYAEALRTVGVSV